MGQAFFTLSVGVGCMAIFGSYVGRERSLASETAWIIAIDTFVAVLSGMVVFPACASYGVDVTSGPGLIFVALPKVFASMAGGRVWGFFFFLFLTLAALTTIVAVFECIIGGLVDELRRKRTWIAVAVAVAVAALSLPTVFFEPVLGALACSHSSVSSGCRSGRCSSASSPFPTRAGDTASSSARRRRERACASPPSSASS